MFVHHQPADTQIHTHLKESEHQGQNKCVQQKLSIKEKSCRLAFVALFNTGGKEERLVEREHLDTTSESDTVLHLNLPFYLKLVISIPRKSGINMGRM